MGRGHRPLPRPFTGGKPPTRSTPPLRRLRCFDSRSAPPPSPHPKKKRKLVPSLFVKKSYAPGLWERGRGLPESANLTVQVKFVPDQPLLPFACCLPAPHPPALASRSTPHETKIGTLTFWKKKVTPLGCGRGAASPSLVSTSQGVWGGL